MRRPPPADPYARPADSRAYPPEVFEDDPRPAPVSYTHLRAHETVLDLVCRLLLEKKKQYHRHIYRLMRTQNTLTTLLQRFPPRTQHYIHTYIS